MADKVRDNRRHPELAEIKIDGLWYGKFGAFNTWRCVIAEMIGAPIRYEFRDRAVRLTGADPTIVPPQTLQFLEARVTDPDRMIEVTPEMRRGIWQETPEEPLWILLLLTIPGGTFFLRHAGAIAQRLDEIDEVVHAADLGRSTDVHEAARHWFARHATSGRAENEVSVTVEGCFDPVGWWDFDPADVETGATDGSHKSHATVSS